MAPQRQIPTVTIENAKIIFRNFEGKEGQYNRKGDRNFAVLLDEDLASQMMDDGWNVKYLNQREEDDERQAYISVSVSFDKGRPPRVVMLSSRGRNNLSESEVEMLDWVDIAKVDLILNPYVWDVSGKSGVKAYLKSLFVTIEEDELDLKYADVEDALPARAGRVSED